MSFQLLVSLILTGVAGAIGHEVAHWVVWRISGRRPRLDVWQLVVHPRTGPRYTTAGDRIAAAAPYVVGLAAIGYGLWSAGILWVAFGLAMVQIPSRVDVATMRGRTEWAFS